MWRGRSARPPGWMRMSAAGAVPTLPRPPVVLLRAFGLWLCRCWRLAPALALSLGAIAALAAPADKRWSQLADITFQHVSQEQGLPSAIATSIAEDGQGFLWVGTLGGLARWDGYRFRVYKADPHRPGHERTYHPGEANLRRGGDQGLAGGARGGECGARRDRTSWACGQRRSPGHRVARDHSRFRISADHRGSWPGSSSGYRFVEAGGS